MGCGVLTPRRDGALAWTLSACPSLLVRPLPAARAQEGAGAIERSPLQWVGNQRRHGSRGDGAPSSGFESPPGFYPWRGTPSPGIASSSSAESTQLFALSAYAARESRVALHLAARARPSLRTANERGAREVRGGAEQGRLPSDAASAAVPAAKARTGFLLALVRTVRLQVE